MINEIKKFRGTYFYILIAGIFLIIISPALLSEGMFMDGMMYANLSKNLAMGLGTFWQPHMTETMSPVYINHPPLAFGLESLFFRVLGNSRFVERIYSLTAIILTGLVIAGIWKSLKGKSSTGWLPLFFWIIIPSVTWATVNNMLENTMGVFIALSVLFYLKSIEKNRILFIIFSGLMLSFGFLTKGFVTFFPLSFPFFYWLFNRKNSFGTAITDSVIMVASAVIPLALLYSLVPIAWEILPKYLAVTFNLIGNAVSKDSRFFIVYRLIMDLLPGLIVILLFLFISIRKKLPLKMAVSNLNLAGSFFCLGLSGVLPIMISRVQSGYYLLTSLPFFAISLALLIYPFVETFIEKINFQSAGYKRFKAIAIVLFSSGLISCAYFSGHINREKNKISDMKAIISRIPENTTISILPEMRYDWSLHAYYGRYKNISLDPDLNNNHEYLLIRTSLFTDTIGNRFGKIDLTTKEFDIYKRK
jgi:4-amino-4-deoxy-L-arabinose transferase-like glycosyltransferase